MSLVPISTATFRPGSLDEPPAVVFTDRETTQFAGSRAGGWWADAIRYATARVVPGSGASPSDVRSGSVTAYWSGTPLAAVRPRTTWIGAPDATG